MIDKLKELLFNNFDKRADFRRENINCQNTSGILRFSNGNFR